MGRLKGVIYASSIRSSMPGQITNYKLQITLFNPACSPSVKVHACCETGNTLAALPPLVMDVRASTRRFDSQRTVLRRNESPARKRTDGRTKNHTGALDSTGTWQWV